MHSIINYQEYEAYFRGKSKTIGLLQSLQFPSSKLELINTVGESKESRPNKTLNTPSVFACAHHM